MHLMIISKLTVASFNANYLTYRVFPISTGFNDQIYGLFGKDQISAGGWYNREYSDYG